MKPGRESNPGMVRIAPSMGWRKPFSGVRFELPPDV